MSIDGKHGAKGFTLIEMMLVLIVVMSLMTLELKRKSAEMNEYAAIAAGRHMKTVADATNAYFVNNYGPLMAGTDPNCLPAATWPCYLNPTALVSQQILPASFVLKTSWDSDYSIAVTRVGASPYYNLNGLVVSVLPWTSDGTSAGSPKLTELGRAVVEMGPDGGFSMTSTEVSGLKGGWLATSADSNKINAIGQLGSRAGYASSVFAQFLRRDGTLPMTGNLSMGMNSIQQANNVTASGAVSGNSLLGNTANVAGTLTSNAISNTTSISTNDMTAANRVSSSTLSTGLVSVTGNASIGGNASVAGPLSTTSINNSGNATIGGAATVARLDGNLEVGPLAVENAACSPNGRIARNVAGLILSCQSGMWGQIGGVGTGTRALYKAQAGRTISCTTPGYWNGSMWNGYGSVSVSADGNTLTSRVFVYAHGLYYCDSGSVINNAMASCSNWMSGVDAASVTGNPAGFTMQYTIGGVAAPPCSATFAW